MKKYIIGILVLLSASYSFAQSGQQAARAKSLARASASSTGTGFTFSTVESGVTKFWSVAGGQITTPTAGRNTLPKAALDACLSHTNVALYVNNYSSCTDTCASSVKNLHCQATVDGVANGTCIDRCKCVYPGNGDCKTIPLDNSLDAKLNACLTNTTVGVDFSTYTGCETACGDTTNKNKHCSANNGEICVDRCECKYGVGTCNNL